MLFHNGNPNHKQTPKHTKLKRRNAIMFRRLANRVNDAVSNATSSLTGDPRVSELAALGFREAEARHALVAILTRRHSIDLFTKDIVLWPIAHSDHWYLVVGLNLGKPNSALFTLNSIGNYGEGAILEHIKAYLAIEFETLPSRDGQLPAIRSLAFASPQQSGGIDCGLYLINNAEAINQEHSRYKG